MLQQLEINNIAIIDKVSIELGDGLNVLTGETGAGKSIIIDSINAIMGQRLSKELIRTGKDKALVEAIFKVEKSKLNDLFEEYGIDSEEDGTLVVSREFTTSGKNICRINGKMATISMLKTFGERLIDVHGQHDNQSLLRTESHIDLLDLFADDKISKIKREYLKHLDIYRKIKDKLKTLIGDEGERERKIDLLKYQIDEIKKSSIKKDEDHQLEKHKDLLLNSERIINTLSDSYEILATGSKTDKSVLDSVNEVAGSLSDIEKYDEKYSEIAKRLEALSYELDDIVSELRTQRDSMEYDPRILDQVEERLDVIYRLKKKYGDSIADILEYMQRAQNELDEIVNNKETIVELNEGLKKESDILYKLAKDISSERKNAAKLIENKIAVELNDLEMKNARFEVRVEFDQNETVSDKRYSQNGLDKVEFLISTNMGEPLKPLSKIASGGEMSRIMLAIKTILANVDKIPTLIFDEIDIGISGKAAQKVGEKLSFISKNHQVISVTHLAQIACMADGNFYIEKITKDNNTTTSVRRLNGNEIKNEIARIIGGINISEITLKHAEEMLDLAKAFKEQ